MRSRWPRMTGTPPTPRLCGNYQQPHRHQHQFRAADRPECSGIFARAGWANGNIEPYEFTDVDRTVAAGLSIDGKQWGRDDDTFGTCRRRQRHFRHPPGLSSTTAASAFWSATDIAASRQRADSRDLLQLSALRSGS